MERWTKFSSISRTERSWLAERRSRRLAISSRNTPETSSESALVQSDVSAYRRNVRRRDPEDHYMDCILCKIIARQLPGYIIAEDESIVVFVSLENHPIVAPREHIPDLFDLNDDLASMVMKMARKVALATKEGLGADGIYVTQTNGAAAGQSV